MAKNAFAHLLRDHYQLPLKKINLLQLLPQINMDRSIIFRVRLYSELNRRFFFTQKTLYYIYIFSINNNNLFNYYNRLLNHFWVLLCVI